ncbi:MAG: hypothetical protein J7480_02975, partial [Microbacteriaceae bacterium]|nr:hypothetical protein [Microbacteriaceae bacterium]
ASENAARITSGATPFEEQAFRADFRPMLGVAMMESTNRGLSVVEAEHILLAILFNRTSRVTATLGELGLTYESFTEALRNERAQTLAAVGVLVPAVERLRAAPRQRIGGPRFTAGAKETWERAVRRARARRGRAQRVTETDFALGILAAELGTVPRALAMAGFDRAALVAALEGPPAE